MISRLGHEYRSYPATQSSWEGTNLLWREEGDTGEEGENDHQQPEEDVPVERQKLEE